MISPSLRNVKIAITAVPTTTIIATITVVTIWFIGRVHAEPNIRARGRLALLITIKGLAALLQILDLQRNTGDSTLSTSANDATVT